MSDPHPSPEGGRAAVSLVKSNNRRGAVAEALALLEDDLRRLVEERGVDLLLMPTLGPSARRSTPSGVLSAAVDAVLAVGGRPIVAHPGSSGDPWGYRAECWGRQVAFAEAAARPDDARLLLATLAELHVVDSCAAGLVVIEGPLDWRGRRVVAVAGTGAGDVAALAANECGLPLNGKALDFTTLPLLGDPPRGSLPGRSRRRAAAADRPSPLTAGAPRAAGQPAD